MPWSSRAPRGLGLLGHHRVEVAPAHHVAVARVHRVLRPGHLEGDAVGDAAQAVVAVVVGGDLLLEPHGPELGDRPRREAVAAGLLPRERLLLDDHHVAPGPAEPVPGRRAGRPAADDEDVVAVRRGHGVSLPVAPEPTGNRSSARRRGSPRGSPPRRRARPDPPRRRWSALGDLEEQLVLLGVLLQARRTDPLVEHDERQLLVVEGGVGGHAAGRRACRWRRRCRRTPPSPTDPSRTHIMWSRKSGQVSSTPVRAGTLALPGAAGAVAARSRPTTCRSRRPPPPG